MKNFFKAHGALARFVQVFGIIALVAVIGFSMAACDNGGSGDNGGSSDPDLSGTISISPSSSVTTGATLTATYSGTETVTYQWKRGSTNLGTAQTQIATEAGSYTVTVSAANYKSKTSTAVQVSAAAALTLVGKTYENFTSGVVISFRFIDGTQAEYKVGSYPLSYTYSLTGLNIVLSYMGTPQFEGTVSADYNSMELHPANDATKTATYTKI